MTLFVLDSSHYQSGLPVGSLRGQGFVGVILKATQGATFTDSAFSGWLAAAKQAELLTAAYHYLEPPSSVSLAAQARHTASVVPADVPVWVDAEGSTTRDHAYGYADALRAAGRRVAGIYHGAQPKPGYGGWWRPAYLSDPTGTATGAYAAQGGDSGSPWSAGQTRHPDIWQFCQHGRVTGYSGDVDLNAYRGTLQQLASSGWFWVPPNLGGNDVALTGPEVDAIASAVFDKLTGTKVVAASEPDPQLAGRTLPGLALMAARRAGMAATAATAAATRVLPAADVDEAALAVDLAPLLVQAVGGFTPEQLDQLVTGISHETATALADLLAARLAS